VPFHVANKKVRTNTTLTILHWIRYGVFLPWTGVPRLGIRREYPLPSDDYRFASTAMDR
jgi:hypothetical protein